MTHAEFIQHTQDAINRADLHQSKLTSDVLTLPGMSSPKVRHFLNNVTDFPGCRYLEIGCWKGSTLISALYGKRPIYWVIDNFIDYGGSASEFTANFNKFFPGRPNLFQADCFAVDPAALGIHGVNVYFYDGWHSEESQYKALPHYLPVMADPFVFIVDDWNGEEGKPVREGTARAVKDLGLKVLFEHTCPGFGDVSQWWNGLWIAVLKR